MSQHEVEVLELKLADDALETYQAIYSKVETLLVRETLPHHVAVLLKGLADMHRSMYGRWKVFEEARITQDESEEPLFAAYKRAVEAFEVFMHSFQMIFPEALFGGIDGVSTGDQDTLELIRDEMNATGLAFFTHLKHNQFARSQIVIDALPSDGLRAALSKALQQSVAGIQPEIDHLEMSEISRVAHEAGIEVYFRDAPGELNDAIVVKDYGIIYVLFDMESAKELRLQQAKDKLANITNADIRDVIVEALKSNGDGTINMQALQKIRMIATQAGIMTQVNNPKGVELDTLTVGDVELPVSYADDVPDTA